VLRVGSK